MSNKQSNNQLFSIKFLWFSQKFGASIYKKRKCCVPKELNYWAHYLL